MPRGSLFGKNAVQGGYSVDYSLILNGSNEYLSRTFGSGNQKTMTHSFWFKNASASTEQYFVSNAAAQASSVHIDTSNRINVYDSITGMNLVTTATYSSTSAWYHICVGIDTTQATAANRVNVYIDGSQITAFDTEVYPAQNADLHFNQALLTRIGTYNGSVWFVNGKLSEHYFIDGQQLTPSSFASGGNPIAYTGSYTGTNDFYLDFGNSSDLGEDSSGSNNDFTANNIDATNQSTDTPP